MTDAVNWFGRPCVGTVIRPDVPFTVISPVRSTVDPSGCATRAKTFIGLLRSAGGIDPALNGTLMLTALAAVVVKPPSPVRLKSYPPDAPVVTLVSPMPGLVIAGGS